MPTPGMAPAFRLKSAWAQPPDAGWHCRPFGSLVFSFAVPVHQRGPFHDELAGSPLASPRPHDCSRHVPEVETPALPNNANVESPPKRVDFAVLIAVAGKLTAADTSELNASTVRGMVSATGAPAPLAVT